MLFLICKLNATAGVSMLVTANLIFSFQSKHFVFLVDMHIRSDPVPKSQFRHNDWKGGVFIIRKCPDDTASVVSRLD